MAEPALGPGTTLDTNGDLTLKGPVSSQWPTDQGLITSRNGLRVDPTTGNAWVKAPFSYTQSAAAPSGYSPAPRIDTNRHPGGIAYYNVGTPLGSPQDLAVTTGGAVTNVGFSGQVGLWTNPYDEPASVRLTTSGVLGALIFPPNNLGTQPLGEMAAGLHTDVRWNGQQASLYTENLAASFGATNGVSGSISHCSRTDHFTVNAKATFIAYITPYYRSTLNGSGGRVYYKDTYLTVQIVPASYTFA